MKQRVLEWLAEDDDVGESSKAMAFCACGLTKFRKAHPWDVSDFIRCMKLLKRNPEIRNYFHLISEMSPRWREFIHDWDRIDHQIRAELGGTLDNPFYESAPIAYAMIRDVIHRTAHV